MAVTTAFQQQGLPPHRPEAEAIRSARIQREEAVIAKAEADLGAGLGIEDDDVEAWLDALEDDPSAPVPDPQNGYVRRSLAQDAHGKCLASVLLAMEVPHRPQHPA